MASKQPNQVIAAEISNALALLAMTILFLIVPGKFVKL